MLWGCRQAVTETVESEHGLFYLWLKILQAKRHCVFRKHLALAYMLGRHPGGVELHSVKRSRFFCSAQRQLMQHR